MTKKTVKKDTLGFGVWGMAPAYPTYHMNIDDFKKHVDKGYMNTYVVEMKSCDRLYTTFDIVRQSKNGCVWLDAKTDAFRDSEEHPGKKELVDGWEERYEIFINDLKVRGYWDLVAGFIWDEALHYGVLKSELKAQLKHLRETYDKRTFLIFCTNEFTTEFLPELPREHIDPDVCTYVTDVAFDAYGLGTHEIYRRCTEMMKEKCGHRDRLNIWHIPCAFEDVSTGKDFDYAMNHFNLCYDLLKEEEHPGGIIAYCYPTWGNQEIGLEETLKDGRYAKYEERMEEVGLELITTPLS